MKLLVAMFLFLFLAPFSAEEEKIIWHENRKLTWADFKATPNGPPDYVASTNSGVSFSFSYKERNGRAEIVYTVRSNFYPNLSWYRPERVSKYILEHEQMHFDISELFARKLKEELATITRDINFKGKAEAAYESNELDRQRMQEQYDFESDHSNNAEGETKWRAYVAAQLEAFSAWK